MRILLRRFIAMRLASRARRLSTVNPTIHGRALFAVCVVGVCVLSGCTNEPSAPSYEYQTRPLSIIVNPEDPEQHIVGELYARTLNHRGRSAFVTLEQNLTETGRIQMLIEESADIVVGCTGTLLVALDPDTAQSLAQSYAAQYKDTNYNEQTSPNDLSYNEATYDALVHALPGTLQATNPSSAQGCADSSLPAAVTAQELGLPQQLVPIFRKPLLPRDQREILNRVTGTISTEDVRQLTTAMEETDSISSVIRPYMQENDL